MSFEHSNPFAGPPPAAVGATEVAAPLMLLDGQPVDYAGVTARMEVLKNDASFMKRVEARDNEAFSEYTKLWRLSRGLPATPETPINAIDVTKESIGRDLAINQVRADSLRDVGFTETQVYQLLNGRPIPLHERQQHERELARLQKDKNFVQRYFDNDPEAVLKMRLVHAGLSMRVGTLEEIGRWEALHAERMPKVPA